MWPHNGPPAWGTEEVRLRDERSSYTLHRQKPEFEPHAAKDFQQSPEPVLNTVTLCTKNVLETNKKQNIFLKVCP